MKLDTGLIEALAARSENTGHIDRAITDFNLANTDSPDIPEHIEMVMMKSSFESLFKIKQHWKEFVRALEKVLENFPSYEMPDTSLSCRWRKRRPGSKRLIECWAKEFCDLRGFAAHGGGTRTDRFVWSEYWHLAFASILFPLLVKAQLNESKMFKLSPLDEERLKRVELYLAVDPVSDCTGGARAQHPWAEIDELAMIDSIEHLL